MPLTSNGKINRKELEKIQIQEKEEEKEKEENNGQL